MSKTYRDFIVTHHSTVYMFPIKLFWNDITTYFCIKFNIWVIKSVEKYEKKTKYTSHKYLQKFENGIDATDLNAYL